MTGPTITRKVAFTLEDKGRKRLRDMELAPVVVDGERIPRRTQLLALALRFEEMLTSGEVHSYAEIARLSGVSRARVSQIMGMLDMGMEDIESALFGVWCTGRGELSPALPLGSPEHPNNEG
ncbi:MAG: hypothetical protein ABIF77_19110, partial [bacterium]